jgi:hypothetical protein
MLSFGSTGAGAGQFSWSREFGSFIDVGPGDTVYVGDKERIQEFDSGGNYLGSIPLPGKSVQALSVDPSGSVYVAFFKDSIGAGHSAEEVFKLDPTTPDPLDEPICTLKAGNPRAFANDEDGNLYVVDGYKEIGGVEIQIRKFESACGEIKDASFPFVDGFDKSTGIAANTVTEAGGAGLYVANYFANSYIRAYYPPPDKWAPPALSPLIEDQFATSVDTDSAVVRARINPRFWADASYYVEYGTGKCSEGGCQAQPLPPGTQLGGGIVSEGITTAGVFLSGLAPATTYHYRFIAQSSGGGPAFGPEETFTTYPLVLLPANTCANAALRSGPSAKLPECRAYEMVSPLDKNYGDIEALERNYVSGFQQQRDQARLDQATRAGEAITYSAARAFAGAQSAPWSSQYISERDPVAGWSTRSINPPRSNVLLDQETNTETPFKAFGEDLCSAWVFQETDLALTPGAPAGVPGLYRRRNCGEEGYEALTSIDPPGFTPGDPQSSYFPEIQGFSAEASHSFMRANAPLTEDANTSSPGIFQLYETSEGLGESAELRLLSVLPSGEAAAVHSSLGTAAGDTGEFRSDSVHNAISKDGLRVFWTVSTARGNKEPVPEGNGLQPGKLYLRANPLSPPSESGECEEADRACTLAIAGADSEFWTANPSGSLVIYQNGEKLFEAGIEEEEGVLSAKSTLIAEGVDGVMGWSEDATKIYLVSSKDLALGAVEGKPNLYFYEKGAGFKLVGTLSPLDASHWEYASVDNIRPAFRRVRVSPDGLHALFAARTPLTSFDNTDVKSGEPDAELFLYGASGEGELACVSCNPGNTRPTGREAGHVGPELHFWTAARIPPWESQQYASRILAPDGSRLFFESYDALLPSDTNGAKDVYEWQRAESQGRCEEIGSPLYVSGAEGCLSLISTGESPEDSEFIDASADGRDVFLTTAESLIPEDPGLVDLYDARLGGGFAPRAQVAPCQGEACQSPAAPPTDRTPASAAFHGAGNRAKARGCPAGARKVRKAGKARCVKAKKSKKHKRKRQA